MVLRSINSIVKAATKLKLPYITPDFKVQTLEIFEQNIIHSNSETVEFTNILRDKIRKRLTRPYESTGKWKPDELWILEERYVLEPENRKYIDTMLRNGYVSDKYQNVEELLNKFKFNNPAQNDILSKYIDCCIDGCEVPDMAQIREFMEAEGFKILSEDIYNIIKKCKYPINTIQYGLTKNNAHLVEQYAKYCGDKGEQAINLNTLLLSTKDVKGLTLEQALNDIKRLAEIKKPDGSPLFNFNYVPESFSVSEILRCKYNEPERYKNIMQLIELSANGRISYQPKVFMPKGKLYQGVVDDMRTLSRGQNYYPEFTSSTPLKDILKRTKYGDAISVGDKMYVRDKENLIGLKMSQECYGKIFPAVDRYVISQGQVDTCTGLSVLNNFLQEPKSRIYFYQLFEQKGDMICIRKNMHSNDILTEFNWKSMPVQNEKSSKGNPIIHILENMYTNLGDSEAMLKKLDLKAEKITADEIKDIEALVNDGRIYSVLAIESNPAIGFGKDHAQSLTNITNKTARFVNPWGSADGREFNLDYLHKNMNGFIALELS